jgi:hypothetical protein
MEGEGEVAMMQLFLPHLIKPPEDLVVEVLQLYLSHLIVLGKDFNQL